MFEKGLPEQRIDPPDNNTVYLNLCLSCGYSFIHEEKDRPCIHCKGRTVGQEGELIEFLEEE